ncbi:helix-turn-helix domain-containing protein [Streptomyces sp. SID5785]|uniref:ArsR/SmtB family transcription factor n=1 Tax=Streptomyces sp. SID5785 TaxID=2690309 RepID=UPI00136127F2|nr:helix-turn-helix domain-containing protein [Streptomyces sp. SID5785]MZD08275.1 helix-turn-helix domain-containing protein [Streptomyces sp. SID5785]
MLRIHFTGDDLLRLRLVPEPDPFWEVASSLVRLQTRQDEPVLGTWRRSTLAGLRAREPLRRSGAMLTALVRNVAYFPDFLTPPVGGGWDEGVDTVLATPCRRLRQEMEQLAAVTAMPGWTEALGRGAPATMTWLGRSLHGYRDTALAPVWPTVLSRVAADVALRTRLLLAGGSESLLDSLRPLAVWRPPVLEVGYPVDRDLHLEGRGLDLVPSFFCHRVPISLADCALKPVLIYPVDRQGTDLALADGAASGPLERLIGPTRAAIVAHLSAGGCRTTTETATAIAVSVPTASQQLALLRDAGLVLSRRDGKYVLHRLSPLGRRLAPPA